VITTKYSPRNIALLLVGIAVALADGWVAAMTAGLGAEPVHDMRSGAIMAVLGASLLIVPAWLITLRWPSVAANIAWGVAALCCLSVWATPLVLLFLILAVVEGLIAANVASRSEEAQPSVVPK